jgi:hypothetical protein
MHTLFLAAKIVLLSSNSNLSLFSIFHYQKAMLNDLFIKDKIRNIKLSILKYNVMEKNNLGSRKINGVQKNIDESKGKNSSHDTELHESEVEKEVVMDADGNKEVVERARNENEVIDEAPKQVKNTNANTNRGVTTEEEAKKTVENEDKNSDITSNRYPNSHPDNHEDRGNMKLDE